MRADQVKTVCVVGSGIMGSGIAQVCAMAGLEVNLRDVQQNILDRARESINKSLDRMVQSGRIPADQVQPVLARIHTGQDLEKAAKEADFVISAISEDLLLKQDLFRELDSIVRPEVVLASNTSQFSITAIASATNRPDRVAGMHFFNPPALMKLVEVVRGIDSSEETITFVRDLAARLGKETVVCKDSQGFITSRAIQAFLQECIRIYEEGVATKEDIDKACKLGFNHPMGPFELADFTGLDTVLLGALALEDILGERFRPGQSIRHLVSAGHRGRKTGRGYYVYPNHKK